MTDHEPPAGESEGAPVDANVDAVAAAAELRRELAEARAEVAALRAQRDAAPAVPPDADRLRELTEVIDDVFWLADASRATLLYVSPAYQRVFGVPVAEVLADGAAWLAPIVAGDRARVEAAVSALPRGYDLEYRIRRGREASWIRERAVPVRDPDGVIRRVAGISEDITRHKQLADQLRQAQKVEAVGQLAGGIAHDFNNLLAVILMQASVLAERAADGTREGLDAIIEAAQRSSTLTRSLVALSRKQSAQPVLLDLGQSIAGATQLLRRELGVDIVLDSRFDPGLPMVHADRGMIEQVLANLVANARDAMTGGGRLTVTVRAVDVEAERAAPHPGAGPGRHVALAVSDSGPGIEPDVLARIFEPFFTTKEVGTGTGLGLPMVLALVEQHHGWVEVDTEVGRGSTVTVLLPAADQAAVDLRASSPRVPVRGGSEKILLVEDEPAVRTVTRVVLQRYGYRVLEAESGAAALAQWDAQGGDIDLVVTDLMMPGGLSGRQLAEALLARAPRLKIIFMSSYSRVFLSRVLHFEPRQLVLPKPCTAAELAASVRRCLDDPAYDQRTGP